MSKSMHKSGFESVDHFVLPKEDWSTHFYQPLMERLERIPQRAPERCIGSGRRRRHGSRDRILEVVRRQLRIRFLPGPTFYRMSKSSNANGFNSTPPGHCRSRPDKHEGTKVAKLCCETQYGVPSLAIELGKPCSLLLERCLCPCDDETPTLNFNSHKGPTHETLAEFVLLALVYHDFECD